MKTEGIATRRRIDSVRMSRSINQVNINRVFITQVTISLKEDGPRTLTVEVGSPAQVGNPSGSRESELFEKVSDAFSHEFKHYKCTHCDKKTSTEYYARKHSQTHVVYEPFECNYCETEFFRESNLNTHTTARHSAERPYKCEFCDYSTRNHSDFRFHLQFKHDDKFYLNQ